MAPLGTLNTITAQVHPRTRKILAAAKLGGVEIQLPSKFEYAVDNKTPEYLAKFPLGKIPTFETASGFCLGESTAIADYVARKGSAREQLLGGTDEEAALIQQWVCFGDGHLTESSTGVAGWRIGYGEYDAKKEETCAAELRRWFAYMEGHLKGRTWLVGGAERGPSMADLVVAGAAYFLFLTYVDREMRGEYPEVVGWYERVVGVPGLDELYKLDMVEVRKAPPS